MRFSLSVLTLFLILSGNLSAQLQITLQPSSGDCGGRILLTDTLIHALNSPPGPGNISELTATGGAYSFEKEHHTVWYQFEALYSGWLSFTIIPDNPDDDYDFMLFPYFGSTICDSIQSGHIEPLRSVISRNDKSIASITGLSDTAFETHISEGPGSSFASSVHVSRGSSYLLVVDNVYPFGSGHRIDFSYVPGEEEPPPSQTPKTTIVLSVRDSSGVPLKANISIRLKYSGGSAPEPGIDTLASELNTTLSPSTFYVIEVRREGYLAYTENIRTRQGEEHIVRKIKLDTISIGKTFQFENVYFRGGTDQFLPGAQESLKQILKMLKDNPTIRVEIKGHINQPYNLISRMSAPESKQLSDQRALAVYNYLVSKGIDRKRLEYKGYGNSQMIFPNARSEEEMRMNRRVEIVITGLNAE